MKCVAAPKSTFDVSMHDVALGKRCEALENLSENALELSQRKLSGLLLHERGEIVVHVLHDKNKLSTLLNMCVRIDLSQQSANNEIVAVLVSANIYLAGK
jgi:hypothetical protein